MAEVETDKQVYLLYQAPYQSNADCLEAFKAHLKVSEAHNGVVGYHLGLSAVTQQKKYIITSDNTNQDQEIEANIKARERYLMCMFSIRAQKWRYKKLKTELKKNYIMGMDG